MSDWNRVLILRRLRWPLLLLLTGVIALLDQLGILTWDHAWPLYLILLGVLGLAERAALATLPPSANPYGYAANPSYGYGYPQPGSPAAPYAGSANASPAWTQNAAQTEQAGIVPVSPFTSLTSTSTSVESSEDHSGEEHRS